MVRTKRHKKKTGTGDRRTVHGSPVADADRTDIWEMIDEIEGKYADLIDELEGDDPRKLRHPKMKVTGYSLREIPRIQEARQEKKKKGEK